MALSLFKKTPEKWFKEAQRIEREGATQMMQEALKYAADFARGAPARWNEEARNAKAANRRKQIRDCIDKALALDPSFAPALLAKGELSSSYSYSTCSGGLRDVEFTFSDEAVRCFDLCISFVPQMADGHYYRARVYECLGDHDAAFACYERAIGLNPPDSEAWHGKARMLALKGRVEEAQEFEERAKKLPAPDVGCRWLQLAI